MKLTFFRRLIAWARGGQRDTSASRDALVSILEKNDEQRRAWIDEELKKPVLFSYPDRPRSDDLKALGLKESDFNPPARPQ